jgi:proline iminopeptidase
MYFPKVANMHKDELYPFYPEILPNAEHFIQVSNLHTIYVASYGNVNGIPVIALHGGPGSGTAPYFARFFDPDKFHIILADQRGAGKSLPKGEMNDNTTQDLIADIETIRHFFNIDQWAVFGGSWGSTLALLYAEAHPQTILGLVLRGIFLVRENDVDVFMREGSPTALLHKKAWEKFKLDTTQLIQQAGLTHLSVETDKLYHVYFELLTKGNQALKETAAGTLSAWEKYNSYLVVTDEELKWSRSPDGINMGLTEATYFEHGCFIQPNQILNDIKKLKNINVYIVQGTYDLVCPPYMADELEAALLETNDDKSLIVRYDCVAGHSQMEPAIRHYLITALNQLAERVQGSKISLNS